MNADKARELEAVKQALNGLRPKLVELKNHFVTEAENLEAEEGHDEDEAAKLTSIAEELEEADNSIGESLDHIDTALGS